MTKKTKKQANAEENLLETPIQPKVEVANPVYSKTSEEKTVEPEKKEEPRPVEPVVQPQTVPEPPKKKGKKIVGPIILCLILVLLIAAAVTTRVVITSPKLVYTNAINKTYKEVSNALKVIDDLYKPNEEAIEISGTFNMDTNLDLKKDFGLDVDEKLDLSKIEISGLIGVDIPNEKIAFDAGVKGSSEKIEGNFYFTDGKAFLKTSFFDKVLKLDDKDVDIDFDEVKDAFKELEDKDISIELYDRILKELKHSLTKSLDPEAMEKEKTEIEVLDKDIKVIKNTYKLSEKNLQKLVKKTVSYLLDDKDFIKDLAKATGLDKSEIKDQLKDIKEEAEEIKLDSPIIINIYSRGILNKFAGFDIEVEKETIISYYTDGDNIEAKIDDGDKIVFTVEKDGKEKKAKLTVDGEKIATATIRSFTDKKIDFDYKIYGDQEITGTVYLTFEQSKRTVEGDYKFKIESDGEYVEFSGSYKIETKDELEGFDTDNAKPIKDIDEEEFIDKLEKVVTKDDELNKIYESIKESTKDSVIEIEEDKDNNNNNNGMFKVDIDEAVSLLSSAKPTVLYIGDTNNYSTNEAFELLNNLEKAQTELGFNSYTIKPIELNDTFKSAIADVILECKTNSEENKTCTEWPAIILINEGKVVKGYRGTVDYNELISELKKIGL